MSNRDVKLAPSILSADFARLGEEVAEAEAAGADRIHIDVMDGHFVPNLTMGVPVVKSLRAVTKLPLEVHLMITDPDLFVDAFAEAGADTLIVHWEGNLNLHRTVQRISHLGEANRRGAQSGHAGQDAGGNPARRRPGAGDDGQPGLRPSAVHPQHDSQNPALARDGSTTCPATSRLELDGGIDTDDRSPWAWRPAPTCWSPARRFSGAERTGCRGDGSSTFQLRRLNRTPPSSPRRFKP